MDSPVRPTDIAAEILSRFQNAVGDLAYGLDSQPEFMHLDDTFLKWKKNAIAEGIQDIPGAYADHLYNDPDAMDMIRDWIFDYDTVNDYGKRMLIYKCLHEISHAPMQIFCMKQIKELEERHGLVFQESLCDTSDV